MNSAYHITGWISVICFVASLAGIAAQLRFIWRRRIAARDPDARKTSAVVSTGTPALGTPREAPDQPPRSLPRPTDVLSLNQFFASFLAFHAFLVYGLCLDPFNHYLVWTRLPAVLLVLLILREIRLDRNDHPSRLAWLGGVLLLLVALGLLLSRLRVSAETRWVATALALVAAAVFAQGLLHQILCIRNSGRTGAVSLRMHQLTLLKDASTVAFALTIPGGRGWPLLAVGGVGLVTKTVLVWHFRWVRLSPLAAARRGLPSPDRPAADQPAPDRLAIRHPATDQSATDQSATGLPSVPAIPTEPA